MFVQQVENIYMLLAAESPVFPVTAHYDLQINLETYKPWCAATELSGLLVWVEGDADTPLKHPEKADLFLISRKSSLH